MAAKGKTLVQAGFGAHAQAYVQSAGHRGGPDLDRVVALAGEPCGRALDVATGGGHTALALAREGWEVVASDMTGQMLRTAGRFLRDEGFAVASVAADAERMPFADGSFRLITCRIAAHHFPDVPTFVAECRRLLKRGGGFVVQDLLGHERPELDAFLHEVETRRDPSHVRSLRLLEWQEVMRTAAFQPGQLHLYRKTHDWEEWTGRTGMRIAEAEMLWRDMLAAPRWVRDYYEIRVKPRRQFVNESAVMSAVAI
jgi:SAM-dependent methyltransferase